MFHSVGYVVSSLGQQGNDDSDRNLTGSRGGCIIGARMHMEIVILQYKWYMYNLCMGLSENVVCLNPMVLLISFPIKWLFCWEYTLFSDTAVIHDSSAIIIEI